MLALGWSDVAIVGELLIGIGAALVWMLSHPGTYMVLGGMILMGMTLWAGAKQAGVLATFKLASIPGIGATGMALILMTVGLLNLFGVLALKDTTEKEIRHDRNAQEQKIQPRLDFPGNRGGPAINEPPTGF